MDYIDKYIKRLERKGMNSVEATLNSTKAIVSQTFSSSPSYTLVKINSLNVDAIVNNDANYDEKQIFFMPDYVVDIGTVVEYGKQNYLIFEFFENVAYPKAKMKLCNSTFPIEADKTKVLMRDEDGNIIYNDFGDPVEIETGGETIQIPCITETTFIREETNEAINLPKGQLNITMSFIENDEIAIDKEFIMYNTKYKIFDIDFTKSINGVGIIVIKSLKI